MIEPVDLSLAEALQLAFGEAGEPSITAVATGSGASRQRLSDWRSGRHVPTRFEDLEPVIAYLQLLARPEAVPAVPGDDGPVTAWSAEQWQQAWKRSTPTEASLIERAAEFDRRPLAIAVMSLLVFLVAALAVTAFFLSWAYR